MCYCTQSGNGKGVWFMYDPFTSFLVSVMAGIIAYIICKWFDNEKKQ